MLCMHVACLFQFCYWGYMKKLHWRCMNIRWIHNLPPLWMWHENNFFGLSILFLRPQLLKIKDEFMCFWYPFWLGIVWILHFFLIGSNALVLWPLNLIKIYALALMLILALIEKSIVNFLYIYGWHRAEICSM